VPHQVCEARAKNVCRFASTDKALQVLGCSFIICTYISVKESKPDTYIFFLAWAKMHQNNEVFEWFKKAAEYNEVRESQNCIQQYEMKDK
jgi:hypothetical protein